MITFNNHKISASLEALGEQLKQARQEKKIKIKDAAAKLNINSNYLNALETGNFNKLPAGIYGKKILQEYGEFLNLEIKPLLEIYDNETRKYAADKQKELFAQKAPKSFHFFAIPKIIKNSLIALTVVVLTAYLGFCVEKIISPPKLIIYYPDKDITIKERHIKIQGKTEKEAKLTINKEMVLIGPRGNFAKDIDLKNGLNIILISAQKKYSRKNDLTRKIIVQP